MRSLVLSVLCATTLLSAGPSFAQRPGVAGASQSSAIGSNLVLAAPLVLGSGVALLVSAPLQLSVTAVQESTSSSERMLRATTPQGQEVEVRLPAAVVRQHNLGPGTQLQVEPTKGGNVLLANGKAIAVVPAAGVQPGLSQNERF